MAKDPQRLIRHTQALLEVSEALCRASLRAIERSKRLLESLASPRPEKQSDDGARTPLAEN